MLTDAEYKAIKEKLDELEALALKVKDQSHAGKLLRGQIQAIRQMMMFWSED